MIRIDQGRGRGEALLPGQALGQRVSHFTKGGLHRAVVAVDGQVAVDLSNAQVGPVGTAIEDGQGDGGADVPSAIATLEQRRQRPAASADGGREVDAREEVGARHTDVGVHRPQLVFGRANVGAAQQNRGGQGAWRLDQHGDRLVQPIGGGGQKRVGHRAARQQLQRVAVFGHLALVRGQVQARGVDRGLVLGEHQARSGAQLMHALGQCERLFARGERVLGQAQALLVGGQVEPSLRHIAHQRQTNALLHVGLPQVLLQGCFAQVAHTAPEIEFERGQAQLHAELVLNDALA